MRYVDGDTGEEISKEDLLKIVEDEIQHYIEAVINKRRGDNIIYGGLSYYGEKYIHLNLGHPDDEDIAQSEGELDEEDILYHPHSLDPSVRDSEHELLINHAKSDIQSWIMLRRAILHHAKNGWPMAKLYWDLLEDLVFDHVTDAPKDSRFKKTELDYLAYMLAAKSISERFSIKLTRNDASDAISTLDLVAKSVGLSYATLKREAYTRYHNSGAMDLFFW